MIMDVNRLPTSLLDLLSNNIILRQISPYIPIKTLLALSASSKVYRSLLQGSREAFEYLDLSCVKSASAVLDTSPIDTGGIRWRAERMDEALTEDEFYCGPLRGIFSRLRQQHILAHVHTLVLDGLSVPADLVREIIAEDRFNVRLLSIRDCKHLNESKLNQVLRYAVRPSRPQGTPKLRGLYIFGHKDVSASSRKSASIANSVQSTENSTGIMGSEGAQIGAAWNERSSQTLSSSMGLPEDKFYRSMGRVVRRLLSEWTETMLACQGVIAFDAVLCRGPRHDPAIGKGAYLPPTIATVALGPGGCETCGSCPEGPAVFGKDQEICFPLLGPPPIHSSTVKEAQRPATDPVAARSPLILRCEDCLRGRWCERCNKWWCEDCYRDPVSRAQPVSYTHLTLPTKRIV